MLFFHLLQQRLKTIFLIITEIHYLKKEPYYTRLAVLLSWYFPDIFRLLL